MSNHVSTGENEQQSTTDRSESTDLARKELNLKARRELLRLRVLDLLRHPDPVRGIYAMYGAHDEPPPPPPQCLRKK